MKAALALLLSLTAAPWQGAYPGSRLVPIGREATVLGQPQRMAYFTTAAPPEVVAEHYARRWRAEGLPVIVQREPSRGAVVASALSTRDGTLVAVVAERIAPGRTLAFLVSRAVWSGRPGGEAPR